MRARGQYRDGWDDPDKADDLGRQGRYGDTPYQAEAGEYDDGSYAGEAMEGYGAFAEQEYDDGEERGLILSQNESLVGISSTVTHHGAPILSYTRTMNRFYTNRKQRLSLGRHRCEVCGVRIRFWSYQAPTGGHTHDGCYERLAWAWTNLYAQQQRLDTEGQLE